MVFRTLARLTGEREGLEDLAQEVFLRLFRATPRFRGEAQITTFLYRIIVNVVNDEFSRRKQARMGSPIEDHAHALEHPTPGPAEEFERSQIQEAVDAALLRLDTRDRVILTLHYQEGRSYEEIAAIQGVPVGTVRSRIANGRSAIAAAVSEVVDR